MNRRQFKSQASSRATAGALGASVFGSGQINTFGSTASPLSYITEPPDLSSISEPSIVIVFKSLSKKDSTTKGKALEDLQTYVTLCGANGGTVEDSVLEAWIKSYPRTSIDSALRVRLLAHTLQGQMTVLTGKRMAKLLPPIIGAWIAGTYDSDKSVARAAQSSFNSAFPSEEKVQGVWTIFGPYLLEYATDAVLKESPKTLSDERTVSPDDAEAKYARVVATGLSVITSLLADVQGSSKMKDGAYQSLLTDDKLWAFGSHKDPFVRRSLYGLLRVCIDKAKDMISTKQKTLSTYLIYKSLSLDQRGSSVDYSRVLSAITAGFPLVWTDFYAGEKPAQQQLQVYLEKGSQAGPPEVWSNISTMLDNIPASVWSHELSSAKGLMNSLRLGTNNRAEIRSNISSALQCYTALASVLARRKLTDDWKTRFLTTEILPILDSHVKPGSSDVSFKAFGEQSAEVCALAVKSVDIDGIEEEIKIRMEALSNEIVERMKVSLPIQSRDFQASQKVLASEGVRWIKLKDYLASGVQQEDSILRKELQVAVIQIVDAAIDILQARDGKPFGVAMILEKAVISSLEDLSTADSPSAQILDNFISTIPSFVFSPSSLQLLSLLKFCGKSHRFKKRVQSAWTAVLRSTLDASSTPEKEIAARSLFSIIDKDVVLSSEGTESLEKLLKYVYNEATEGNQSLWDLISTALNHSDVSAEVVEIDILEGMLKNLSIQEKATASLDGFDVLSSRNKGLVLSFTATERGAKLISTLLFLAESPDHIVAQRAENIIKIIEFRNLEAPDSENHSRSILNTIRSGLLEANSTSLSIETLVARALKLIQSSPDALQGQILPRLDDWAHALTPFLNILPNPSTAITNPLAGSVYLIEDDDATKSHLILEMSRDQDGLSPAIRMAIFTVQLIQSSNVFGNTSLDTKVVTFKYIVLMINLANDNLGYAGSNNLWIQYDSEMEDSMLSFVSSAQILVKSWLESLDIDENDEIFSITQEEFEASSSESSPLSFQNARALAYLNSESIELHGWQEGQDLVFGTSLKQLKGSSDTIALAGLLAGFPGTPASLKTDLDRFCGELISKLTTINAYEESRDGLQKLILLNTLALYHEEILANVNPQRVVFLVKNILSTFEGSTLEISSSHKAEAMKLLQVVLPLMQDMYGSHWTSTLDMVISTWSKLVESSTKRARTSIDDLDIPMLHASLRLYSRLGSMAEANEDLEDAWKSSSSFAGSLLVEMLRLPQAVPDDFHQPLKITNQLLSRVAINSVPEGIKGANTLYPILYSESSAIQSTAYEILHRYIPSTQGELSIEAALSNTHPSLPIELLSLVIEVPSVESIADYSFERDIPLPLRGYLLSWILVFDHFINSSIKVRQDYIISLQECKAASSLLSFIFSCLLPSKAQPGTPKFKPESLPDITQYTIGSSLSPPVDFYHLLVHIYYLSLRHIPVLAKSWVLSSTSRGRPQAIQSFTEKYVSPYLIVTELDAVSEYFNNPKNQDDTAFSTKVLPRAREVQAAYEVDDQTMKILITLSSDWPLGQVQVDGVNRVAVEEKRWLSWCQTVKGVIALSNGSVVDGINAWRKNVTGALKGQTECSICYSIISGEKELPSKRCQTCKNLFHGSCLFKWFKSSNSASCPLCRNAFHYG